VTAQVTKGNIIVSVSGSGQISASNQIDIKPKVSGDVIYLGVKSGQVISAGTLIAELDSSNAQKTVRDAEVSLESAKITLEKLKGPDSLAVPRNKTQAEEDLSRAYEDGFNTVSNAFLNLPSVMSGLQAILFNSDRSLGSGSQTNLDYYSGAVLAFDDKVNSYKDDALKKYQDARAKYDQNFSDYKSVSRYSSAKDIEKIINETYETTKVIAEAVKSSSNLLQFHKDKLIEHNLSPQTLIETYLSNLNSYTGTTNTYLVNLLSVKNTIQSDRDAILNADLDLRSQVLSIRQKENALADAKEQLANYYIRAPFGGVIASVGVKKYDSASSGTVIATLITSQKIAEVSLNEVDASKIKVGQKATLTFDAIENLTITGSVSEVETIGTVSQGVVTYNIKISFDTQDDRVKSGMSVSASIITDVKQDVLTVPNSAIKNYTDGSSYVEMFSNPLVSVAGTQGTPSKDAPNKVPVEIGLANDNLTEIKSGIKEGDQVVARTITTTQTATKTTTTSLFGGGGVRVPRN
jgi:HlyD family secretion protein